MTLFFPASQTVGYMTNVLSTLTLADTGQGPILFYPFYTDRMSRPLFQVPAPREAFHLSVLRTGAPPTPEVINAMLAGNRTLYDDAVESAVPDTSSGRSLDSHRLIGATTLDRNGTPSGRPSNGSIQTTC